MVPRGELLDYTIGGYYFKQTTTYATHQFLPYAVPGFEFYGNDPVEGKSYAGFANASVHATDALNINAGIRYTHESKVYNYSRLPVGGSLVLGLDSLNGNPGRYSGSKVDYRLNVDYRWSEALMTYASVSTAFKGGGTNARPFGPGQVVPFDKEKLTAYELGAKSDFLDNRLRGERGRVHQQVQGHSAYAADLPVASARGSLCGTFQCRRRRYQGLRGGNRGAADREAATGRLVQRPELQVHAVAGQHGTDRRSGGSRHDQAEVEHRRAVRRRTGQWRDADAPFRLLVPGRLQHQRAVQRVEPRCGASPGQCAVDVQDG